MSKCRRQRGVILTDQGSRKLYQAKSQKEIEQDFQRYTLESLSQKTGLTPTTLSKIFTGSAGVDKRTLKSCFNAFDLTLLTEDYLHLKSDQNHLAKISPIPSTETCSDLGLTGDFRRNIPQTNKMAESQADLQPCPPTLPGGQMPLDSVLYIDRLMLESLCYEHIHQPGTLINIRAPKQMGKTSLMSRILAYAKTQGYQTVSLNLQLPDGEILQNLESFLQWFCARVSKQLNLPNLITDFWDNFLGSKSNATDYFEDMILANLVCPLVIGIDELNQLFAYPDIGREFLLLLRTWSEKAKARVAQNNLWQKLRLVSVHSTEIMTPSLIDPSLWNTGLVIDLPEFIPAQVQELAQRWQQQISEPQIKQLITLLGGHPYRLQLAFYYLQQQTITLEELLEDSAIATDLYAEHLQQQWWNLQRYPELWTVFTKILRQSSPVECEAEQASQLQNMGLVHRQGLQVSLACELFRPFFCDRLSQLSS